MRTALRGKVVVVGASAPSLQDVHATSTTGNSLMSGPEIQANAIATLQEGIPLQDASAPVQGLLIVLLGLVTPLSSSRLLALRSFLLALVAGALFAVGNQFAFQSGLVERSSTRCSRSGSQRLARWGCSI